MRTMFKRAVCVDGFSMSVQAGRDLYCSPREDERPDSGCWDKVEVGYPNEEDSLLMPYAENRDDLTNTVYGWVPSSVVAEVVAKHGGLVDSAEPKPWE